MSILGSTSYNGGTGSPFFHEFKKQASFFFKEKIKTARLALTDVTPVQLMTEEATNGNPWSPDTRTLKTISRAAFEIDDYWRIVQILHKRLYKFDRKNWRLSYNALIVLEHLLTHGPESFAEEFQDEKYIINQMATFQHIDEKGFNWGLTVQRKCERILKLLEKGPLLKEERDRARKVSRGIEGFGSFCQRSSSSGGVAGPSNMQKYGRSNSQFNEHGNKQDKEEDVAGKKIMNSNPWKDATESFKKEEAPQRFEDESNYKGESNPLLGGERNESRRVGMSGEDHPFSENEFQANVSLLSSTDQLLQAY